ncbi:peptidase T [Garciella nitratireducens]|uniref:Peptidase T n=1 Tax=Garciella nitratireducens DSM 15102 TaxID=1121911 RepID=A0A1T4KZZ6_9FIRM|nr:peptidase T [Garciella nitratireducens]RBP36546.1 tripeptide aminopeptidase [Garciella nitratireducens]SJZ48045.1 tripeptide aminopeptidase [Garciella nitratireducens DSM 15102]
MEKIVERFQRYIAIDTRSDEQSNTCPSTPGQLELGALLVKELHQIGLYEVRQDKNGYVYAVLPSNLEKKVPAIGFIAHLDTSPDLDGKCVNPKIFTYQGGDIRLNDQYSIKVQECPFLKDLEGQEIITTDGTTLLGADDKAGVAAIMDAMEYLINHPEIKHGKISIAFTPDEEIGRGADNFDIEGFGVDFAYTVDGGALGELEYENFNAASVQIDIQGKNVHPGSAKNIMVNSILVAMELESMLPVNEKPEYTQGYEGFYLLTDMKGCIEHTTLKYIIRDHSKEKFQEKKVYLEKVIDYLNDKYGQIIAWEIKDTYYNMKEKILPHKEIIELAKQSMKELGIIPLIRPIRGGTDGARLSYMGLPCPNFFAGGYNAHGRYELIPTNSLKLASQLIVRIVENNSK